MLLVIFLLRIFALSALMFVATRWNQTQTAGQPPAASQPATTPSPSPTPAGISVLADSTQLEVIKAPQPDYPLEAAAAGIAGRVWIQLHISENGDVERTEVMGGDPLLAKAAESAMKQWKFKPFIKDGKPVPTSRKVPFDFVLKGKPGDPCSAVEAILAMNHGNDPLPPEVMEGALIHKVEPAYPVIARMKHVQGKVILLAIIGDDGRIRNLKPVCGPPDPGVHGCGTTVALPPVYVGRQSD
jgi:TonB family protein